MNTTITLIRLLVDRLQDIIAENSSADVWVKETRTFARLIVEDDEVARDAIMLSGALMFMLDYANKALTLCWSTVPNEALFLISILDQTRVLIRHNIE